MNTDLSILAKALQKLKNSFDSFPDTLNDENKIAIEQVLLKVANRLKDNYPYFQPEYAGQMLKPPHAIARLAYMLALYINPNNHALDGGRASSQMEKEVVTAIAEMFGWYEHLGHLTSGGTMANLEALWVAKQYYPDKKIVASELAHYTHQRISKVLGIPFESIPCNQAGHICLESLERILKTGEVGTVVVTMGTTGIGSVDPLIHIFALQKVYNFRIHVDAAYGGYFGLLDNLDPKTKAQYEVIRGVDSIVIDPHKHGLQPYGCGCILFKDKEVVKFYKHDSPYTYFTTNEMHLGEISLECSRAGAAAVALWATLHVYPLIRGGQFAQMLMASRQAALNIYQKIKTDEYFITLLKPETDIVVWAPVADSLSQISQYSKDIFRKAAQKHIHLAIFSYPTNLLPKHWQHIKQDHDSVTCLRVCLMKPEHLYNVNKIWKVVKSCL